MQRKFLMYFSQTNWRDVFYWTGGTALAEVYLKHRFSEDIDLFTDQDVRYDDLIALVEGFLQKEVKVKEYKTQRIHDRKIFILENEEMLKIEFTKYEHQQIKKRTRWKKLSVRVDSLEDIATNKIMSIMDRREPKDVVDMYYILQKNKYSLTQLLRWVEKKFGPVFDMKTLVVEIMGGVKLLSAVEPLLVNKHRGKGEIEKIKQFYYELADRYLRERFE